jgi:hypothetical protein
MSETVFHMALQDGVWTITGGMSVIA